MGHRGGKKGGKARGVGGFHDMDPEKQVWQEVFFFWTQEKKGSISNY